MHKTCEKIIEQMSLYSEEAQKLPNTGLGKYLKVQSALFFLSVLEDIARKMESDPFKPLSATIESQRTLVKEFYSLSALFDADAKSGRMHRDSTEETKILFENAWTVYNRKTYEHSVQLIIDRLQANKFDQKFFAGKTCFDGGCGTGRFAVAMAKLGAKHVVAVDIGGESIQFGKNIANELAVKNIEFVKKDVTDLRDWKDESFDLVVSNGVLHHAVETERGIREHFRITKKGGIFWLYLYGAGGIYWDCYDKLKEVLAGIEFSEVRQILLDFGLKQGTIYTFLDNVCAPIRKYYYLRDIEECLKNEGKYSLRNLKGTSVVDDTEMVLETQYGKYLYGPDGEVRVRIDKH